MFYFKIVADHDNVIGVIAFELPSFIKWQERNRRLVRCPKEEAQGIVSDADNNTIYRLNNQQIPGVENDGLLSAVSISQAEYEEYEATHRQEDPEDLTPEIPEDTPEEEILTRAELTQKIKELETQNEFLQDCLLEMSEVVYG